MKLQECKTVKEVQDWLRQENDLYEGLNQKDRRKTPRGDVARGLVDAVLVGGVPTPFQDATKRATVSVCEHCGLSTCDVKEID